MSSRESSFCFREMSGSDVGADPRLLESVLELDRANMVAIMEASGFVDFPWEKRIAGLTGSGTRFFGAFSDGRLCGYLEILPDHRDPDGLYVSSLQIVPELRGSRIFITLLRTAHSWVGTQSPANLRTEIQSENRRMIAILGRLGFQIEDGKRSHTKIARIATTRLRSHRIFR